MAPEVEFMSFGTNDLTQMTYGFSRDDVGKFLPAYLAKKLVENDPFVSLDQRAVGRLMEIAVKESRARKPGIKYGICGEHGGDPRSIRFCHELGLDYVSCSPYRVPIARIAAAQANVGEELPRSSLEVVEHRDALDPFHDDVSIGQVVSAEFEHLRHPNSLLGDEPHDALLIVDRAVRLAISAKHSATTDVVHISGAAAREQRAGWGNNGVGHVSRAHPRGP